MWHRLTALFAPMAAVARRAHALSTRSNRVVPVGRLDRAWKELPHLHAETRSLWTDYLWRRTARDLDTTSGLRIIVDHVR
jgi:hypothetical protein